LRERVEIHFQSSASGNGFEITHLDRQDLADKWECEMRFGARALGELPEAASMAPKSLGSFDSSSFRWRSLGAAQDDNGGERLIK
jgi:hypothetical protein